MLIRIVFSLLLFMSSLVQAQETFTILFLGDSLTEGLGLEPDQAFPNLIEERLQAEGYHQITIILLPFLISTHIF